MKKYSLLLMFAALLFCLNACQKDEIDQPQPPTPIDTSYLKVSFPVVTTTSVTAHFEMNNLCSSYTVMLSEAGTMSQWIQMFGASLERCISMWGVTFSCDTSFVWNGLTPATDHYIYILAKGTTQDQRDTTILDSVAVRTATMGGDGESVITIQVSNITASSALVTCVPNEETALFKDMLITVEAYNQYGADSVLSMLKESPYTYYATDTWNWEGLDINTPYYVLAIGQNARGEWGPMALQSFSTLARNK